MMKDAYYFSHDSNSRNDEKIISLRMDHGWEGYGIYWALIEMLRDSAAYELETHYKRIAFALHTESELIKSIITNYDLFKYNEDFFWSESLKIRMDKKDQKSKKARESAQKRWGSKHEKCETDANALETQCDSNANKEKKSKEKESKEKENKEEDNIKEILNHLNEKTGKSFRTAKGLKSRLTEGYTVEDVKKVIDIKCSQWANDPAMNQYLRPQTLFSEKFDGYLNENIKPSQSHYAGYSVTALNAIVDKMRDEQATTQDIDIFMEASKEGFKPSE